MDAIIIVLLIIFIDVSTLGFFIIYKQVALVKKGEFNLKDRFECIVYGVVFGLAIMVVISMAFIFTVETPEFWESSTTPAPKIDPLVLLIPFVICLAYISFYPLIDFLFIALSKESDEGLTPFHKFIGDKIINKSKSKPVRVILAVGFYFIVFFFPPLFIPQFIPIYKLHKV